MANQLVDPIRTVVSQDQLVPAFIAAWRKLVGSDPSKQQIAMLLSQNALETGGFTTKAMFNYNIGNITKTPSDNFDYFQHPDSYHGKRFMSKFRSYPSLEDGVYDYIRLLQKGYPQAFAASNQSPKDFAYALVSNPKAQYYDATHREDYAAGMTARYNQLLKSDTFNTTFGQGLSNTPEQATTPPSNDFIAEIKELISKFLEAISSEKQHGLIKNNTLTNKYLIRIISNDISSSIEFARILSSALDEELSAKSITFCGTNIEIESKVNGNYKLCSEAIVELCDNLSYAFEKATNKIGGVKIISHIIPNGRSNYQKLGIKLAQVNYDLFHKRMKDR